MFLNRKTKHSGFNLPLKNLVEIKEWQKIQDNFAVITNVGLRICDTKAKPLTHTSGESRLCKQLLKESPVKHEICGPCLPTFLGGKSVVDKNMNTVCKIGLNNFIVPIKFQDIIFGYLIMGPVILVARKPKEEYRKAAAELSVNIEELWSALLEIKVISFQNAQSIIELIKDVTEYMLKLSYNKLEEGKNYMFASGKLNKILSELLDVAFQISGANVGSLMLVDRAKDELSICSSRGLPEDIVRRAQVKMGEGVSGIVAKEGKPYLINKGEGDNRISRYLNRPALNSSMIIPIKIKNNVFGVINLGSSKPSNLRFDDENLKIVSRLVGLSTAALQD